MADIINNDKIPTSVTVNIYKDNEGRRKALLDILNRALSLNKPSKLYFISQEDILWLIEDKDYIETLKMMIIKIIAMGHKLVIIHNLDRGQSSLLYTIPYWIPVYLSGCVDSYYLNTYSDSLPKTTILILENTACAFSYALYSNTHNNIMFAYSDEEIIQTYQNIFNSILANSQPLGEKSYISSYTYFDTAYRCDKKNGYTYLFLHDMYSFAMPLSLYEKILSQLGISKSEQKRRLNLYKARFYDFIENIKKYKYIIIICSNVFDQICEHKAIPYWGADFFEQNDVIVEYEDFTKHIHYLSKLSKAMHNLELYFISPSCKFINVPSFNYLLKENDSAFIFNQNFNIKDPILLRFNEFSILRSFQLLHKNMLEYLAYEQKSILMLTELIKENEPMYQNFDNPMFIGLLTKKEQTIAQLLLEGISVYQIAEKAFISKNTVKTHIKNIYRKLEVTSKYEFINKFNAIK